MTNPDHQIIEPHECIDWDDDGVCFDCGKREKREPRWTWLDLWRDLFRYPSPRKS